MTDFILSAVNRYALVLTRSFQSISGQHICTGSYQIISVCQRSAHLHWFLPDHLSLSAVSTSALVLTRSFSLSAVSTSALVLIRSFQSVSGQQICSGSYQIISV
jgi:hypothetical protein